MASTINPFYNRLARDYEDRDDELRAAAAKVQETVSSPGWGLLWEMIDGAREDAMARLIGSHGTASGKVLEQAEYARIVAYLAGLSEPRSAAQAYEQALARLVSSESPE